MNYCQSYFQKNLDDLTADDITNFFNTPQKESQFLEFKSSRERNLDKVFSNSLKPGICSFLNSEGGILIYGAPKENKKNPDHPFQGEIEPYENGFLGDHDTIIRKISGGIIPMPVGIRLKEVEFPEGFVAVFEIQQSQTKPHQTENIYQIRIDGQKTPAPHYLIEAMMKQVQFPILNGKITYKNAQSDATGLKITLSIMIRNLSEFQNESDVFVEIKCLGASLKKDEMHTFTELIPVVSHGFPKIQDFILFLNQNQLERLILPHNIELAIFFGGKSAPTKISACILRLVFGNRHRIFKDDIEVILRNENLSILEYKENQSYKIYKKVL